MTRLGYRGPGQTQRLTAGGTSYQYDATGLSQSSSGSPAYSTTTPDGEVLSERLSTGTYCYLHDGLGSVVALTDSSGSVVNSYAYDPYGNTTSGSGTVANPFRYAGAVWDSSTGLYQMGQRFYDPTIGRFTQLDPAAMGPCMGSPAEIGNYYAYVGGDPVNYLDQEGLKKHRSKKHKRVTVTYYERFTVLPPSRHAVNCQEASDIGSLLTAGGAVLVFVPGAEVPAAILALTGLGTLAFSKIVLRCD